MPWRELPAFIAIYFGDIPRLGITERLLLFLILTAARSGEVRGMSWREFDARKALWTIPGTRMKGGQLHRVPLSTQALQLVGLQQDLHPQLVFPSPRLLARVDSRMEGDAIQKMVSDMGLTALLRRLHAPSDTQGRYATAHGFRSTFRDWCSEQGVAKDLAERSLAHSIQNKVEAAYHRTDLLDQRVNLMQDWANFCLSPTVNKTD